MHQRQKFGENASIHTKDIMETYSLICMDALTEAWTDTYDNITDKCLYGLKHCMYRHILTDRVNDQTDRHRQALNKCHHRLTDSSHNQAFELTMKTVQWQYVSQTSFSHMTGNIKSSFKLSKPLNKHTLPIYTNHVTCGINKFVN